MKRNDAGITMIEVLIAVFLTTALGIGVSTTFGASVSSIGNSQKTSFVASGSSTLNASLTRDVELSNGILVPNSSVVDSISAAAGDGATVTYTYGGHDTLAVGQSVSITGMLPVGYNVTNVTVASIPSSTTFTIASTATGATVRGGVLVPLCTTWVSSDTSFTAVRPLLTLSEQSTSPITSATGTGSIATYSYSGNPRFTAGQSITVSGLVPAAYNTIAATISSVDTIAKTFSVANAGTGSTTTSGIALYNTYVGYEVRTLSTSASLWRIQCPWPLLTALAGDSQMLRAELPVSSDSSWTSAVQCSAFTSGSVVLSTCPANTLLTSNINFAGINFTVPATLSSATSQYPVQVILAARSIS